jgi:SNF2 family DNA or RNA helicase
MLSSAVVTLGPLCRIEGQLPAHAIHMAKQAGAFQHGGEVMCRRRDWERVQSALKAAGVQVRVDGSGPVGQAVLGLGTNGTGYVEGVLPRRLEKTWLGRLQGRKYANISPFALRDVHEALLTDKVQVTVQPEYRKLAFKVDDMAAGVIAALTTADDELPDVKLKDGALRPYQRRAIAIADALDGRMYLADEPGVGKTLPAIAYALHRECKRILVICPGSLKGQWRDEIEQRAWGDVFIARGQRDERVPASTRWLIINPELLTHRFDQLSLYNAQYVIRDEAHSDKNQKEGSRVDALTKLACQAPYYWPLTGTPIDDKPIDAWVQFHAVRPNWWGARYEFGLVHCHPEKNWWASNKAGRDIFDFTGVTQSTKPVLRERLQMVMLRRTIDAVGLQMPRQTRTQMRVDLSADARKQYDAVTKEYRDLVREASKGKSKEEAKIALDKLRPQRAKLALQMRRVSSMGRIDETVEVVISRVEAGERIIIFGFFRETVEALRDALKKQKVKVDLIYGGDQARREDVIKDFKDGKLDVLVSSIEVGGVGLNLQHVCRTTIAHELSYKPIHITQSEARVYRSGQEKPVQHIYMMGEGTMDERVLGILFKKMGAAKDFLEGDRDVDEEEMLREIEASFFHKDQ